jgi:hypothetical protein
MIFYKGHSSEIKSKKFNIIYYFSTLLSGCFNPFGIDLDSAKSDIAEEIYYNHLRSNYSYSLKIILLMIKNLILTH